MLAILLTDPEDPRQRDVFKSLEEETCVSTRKRGCGGREPSWPPHVHIPTLFLVQEQYSGNNVENCWGKNILIRCAINHERKLKWYCSVWEVQYSPRNASGIPSRTTLSNTVVNRHTRPFRQVKCNLVRIDMCLPCIIHTGFQRLSRTRQCKMSH